MAAIARWFLVALLLATVGTPAASALSDPADQNLLPDPRFESVGKGIIPRDVVPALAQDRSGLLWIATGDGLVRFDGYRFRALERNNATPARRSLGWIRALLPARDGRLWIGTESEGLAVHDPLTEQVSDLGLGQPAERAATSGNSVPTIRALAEDRDGVIWVGSLGGGLHRYDPATGRFTNYRHSPQTGSLPDDRVQALLVDQAGTLWVGSWHGLARLVRGSSVFEPVAADLLGPRVDALVQAADGRIWAGAHSGVLAVIDPRTLQASRVAGASRKAAPGAAVTSLVETPDGEMWVGTVVGIDIYSPRLQLRRKLRHDARIATGLNGNEVTTLVRDRAGWLWVGGFGLGLQRHNPHNRSIGMRRADLSPGSRLEGASVRSLLQLDNGELLAASQRGGVAVLDAGLRAIGELELRGVEQAAADAADAAVLNSESPAAPRITAMAQSPDGSLWLATNSVLFEFDRKRKPVRTLELGAGATTYLLAGSEGSLWLGTEDGIHRLPPGGRSLLRVGNRPGKAPFGGAIHVIAEAPDRAIWVGTPGGLFRIAPGTDEPQAIVSPAGAGLGNPIVTGLLFDRQQALWVDTGVAGLHRLVHLDGNTARFDRISERHGIVNKPFGVNLLEDRRGRIWTQLHVYDPKTDRLSELTPVDGADLGTGWFHSYTGTRDGRMLFGGSKGIMEVHPEAFEVSDYAPPLLVSELRINGQRQAAEGGLPDGLLLDAAYRSFSIEFAALDYSDPARIQYAYRLEGVDPDWISGGAGNRLASYSKLDPGSYVMRARATNRSGVWSPNELAIPVRVLPAWWEQWWFRLLATAATLGLIGAFVQLRTRRLRVNQQLLERKVEERTSELQTLTVALQEASLTDPLTGLRNRRFLILNIGADAALAVREYAAGVHRRVAPSADADLIFFMFDLDHFKDVNDRYGHAAGDGLILQTCERLKTVFRETDYLVRWGGEEFLVVARRTSRRHAAELAERARAAVADTPFTLSEGLTLAKTCSVGFACFPLGTGHPQALDWEAVLNIADASLFAAKAAGRNCWLGVVDIEGDSASAVQQAARLPLADGARSGALVMACSTDLGGWPDSTGSARPESSR